MNLDHGRKFDLEELAGAIDKAKTVQEREHYERIAYRICNESAPIQSLRSELLRAFRARDIYRVKAIENHIHKIRMDETYGKSWGQNKGERQIS